MSKKNQATASSEVTSETVTETPAGVTVKAGAIVLTSDQQTAFNLLTNKSSQIRYLNSIGHKNGPIAKFLTGIYYPNGEKTVLFQHVRNVLNQPLKSKT